MLIFFTEDIEVVVPKPGVLPGVMDPEHELAVVRVEAREGEVRALIWDRRTIERADEALVIPLTSARASTTLLSEE
ncbi:hypothetical protein TFLX_06073 [Thermoflexales bacterium]|nr:hypothetical protein TFLX_06073 [Thermoflexales bacterium]